MNMMAQEEEDSAPRVLATNTLLITHLLDPESFTDVHLQALQAQLELHGEVLRFIPIRSLARCMGSPCLYERVTGTES